MKVYGVNLDGVHRGLVAATSKLKAAEALGVPLGQVTKYGCVTGNEKEIAIAMSTPGLPWRARHNPRDSPYERVEFGKHWQPISASD